MINELLEKIKISVDLQKEISNRESNKGVTLFISMLNLSQANRMLKKMPLFFSLENYKFLENLTCELYLLSKQTHDKIVEHVFDCNDCQKEFLILSGRLTAEGWDLNEQ